jgi:hypothetical protein
MKLSYLFAVADGPMKAKKKNRFFAAISPFLSSKLKFAQGLLGV